MASRAERRKNRLDKVEDISKMVQQPALSQNVFVSCKNCPYHFDYKVSEGQMHENFKSICKNKARCDIYYGQDLFNGKLSFYTLYVVINEKCVDAVNIILEGAE